jgi:hypothetical protein
LYFWPLPQGQGSFGPTLGTAALVRAGVERALAEVMGVLRAGLFARRVDWPDFLIRFWNSIQLRSAATARALRLVHW